MRKSATILGSEYGLTYSEMTLILNEEGYLDNGVITEKETKYGKIQSRPNYWFISWDDEIKNDLNISEDRIIELRQATIDAKQKIMELNLKLKT